MTLLAFGAFATEPPMGRSIRPDQLGLSEVYSLLALEGGDLLVFGRDSALRGLWLRLPAGKSEPELVADLGTAEAAQIRQPDRVAMIDFPLAPGKRGQAMVLLYQRDDSTPYWLQSETGLIAVALREGRPIERTTVKTLTVTSVALKDRNAEPSRWEYPGGESADPKLADDPPGWISRVSARPYDVDHDGWQDLVLSIDACRSALKASSLPRGEGGCSAGFAAQPTRTEAMRFNPISGRFEELAPLLDPPARTPDEVAVGELSALGSGRD